MNSRKPIYRHRLVTCYKPQGTGSLQRPANSNGLSNTKSCVGLIVHAVQWASQA
jgi:hypothetical protein